MPRAGRWGGWPEAGRTVSGRAARRPDVAYPDRKGRFSGDIVVSTAFTQKKEAAMARHLADHRASSQGGRVKHFLRIAREGGERLWHGLARQPQTRGDSNRRVVEYARIARGRQT
jgi:hypothetical protein